MNSRKRKRLLIGLAVVAVAVIAAFLVLPKVFDLNRYRDAIAVRIQQATGGEASLNHISWGIAGGLWLAVEGLKVRDTTIFAGDIELPRVHANVSLLPLLKKKVVIQELRFERPVLSVRFAPRPVTEDAAQSAEDAPTDDVATPGVTPGPEGSPLPVTFEIQQIQVKQGRVTLHDSLISHDGTQVHRLDDVDIEINNLVPGEQMAFQFALHDQAKPGLGSLSGRGTFSGLTDALTIADPELEMTATLRELDAEVIEPYVKDTQLAQGLSGSVSLEIHYAGDLGQRFDAKGHIDLSKIAYTDASLWKEPLPGAQTRLAYELRLSPDRIKLTQVDLELGKISITGQALIDDWRKQPVVRNGILKGTLSLADLKRLMPQGLLGKDEEMVRQLLAGGGEVVVEQLALPDLTAAQMSRPATEWIEALDVSLTLSGISFSPSAPWPKLTDITGKLRLNKGELSATDMRGLWGPLTLPPLELHATSLMTEPKITASTKGPLKLIGAADATVEQLLLRYGLKHLSGDATIDMHAHYDVGNPASWDATGSLELEGVQAENYPGGVRLEDLRGRVSLRRTKGLDITVEGLTGRVNQSSVEIDGKVINGGAKAMVLAGRAKAESLDLAHFASLVPALKTYQVGGKLDMDLQIHYAFAEPMDTRMTGKIQSSGLAFKWQDLLVEEGNADISLSGQTINVKATTMRVNDQVLQLSGDVTGLHEPKVRLHLKSDNLNLDRLLPSGKATDAPATPPAIGTPVPDKPDSTQPGTDTTRDAKRSELPQLARQSSINILAELAEGRYRKEPFRDVRLHVDYDHGVVKNHTFDAGIAGGHVTTQGSVDLRNLARIQFDVTPGMTGVSLESVSRLIGLDDPLLHDPLTMNGRLRGLAGAGEESLTSLSGNLTAEVGPGRIRSKSTIGQGLFNLLSFIHIEGILSGEWRDDFAAEGIPYDTLKIKAKFQDGSLIVDQFKLVTPALSVRSTGAIDLVHQRLNMKAHLAVVKTADEVLGYVPLVGKVVRDMTEVHLDVTGPVDKPEMQIRPAAGVIESVKDEVKGIGGHIKGIFKRRSHHHDDKTAE